MGGFASIGGSDSTSENSSQNAGAESRLQRGNNNLVGEAGSLTIGTRGNYLSPGSAQITGAKNVQVGDPNAIPETFAGVQALLKNFTSSQSDQSAQNAALLNSALDQVAGLSQSAQTGGASAAGDTYTKLLLGGLAIAAVALVAWLLLRKK